MNIEPAKDSTPNEPGRDAAIESLFDLLAHKVETTTLQTCAAWSSATTNQILDPLRESVLTAARHHSELVEKLLSEEDPVTLNQVTLYRQAFLKQILQPLVDELTRLSAPEVWNYRTELLDRLSEITDQAPEECTLSLPWSLYQIHIEKKWRVRKFLARSKFHLIAWGRRALRLPPEDPTRTVHLRLLFQYHIQARIANTLVSLSEGWEQHAAELIRQLEVAFFGWTNTVLMSEYRLEQNLKLDSPFLSFFHDNAFPEEPSSDHPVTENLLSEVHSFQETLEQVASQSTLPNMGINLALKLHHEHLVKDFGLAGTIFLRSSARKPPKQPPKEPFGEPTNRWPNWRMQALNKMNLCVQILHLRDTFVFARHEILRRVADRTLWSVWNSFEKTAVLLDDYLKKGFHEQTDSPSDILENLQTHVLEAVRCTLARPSDLIDINQELQNSVKSEWAVLKDMIMEWPDSVVLHVLSSKDTSILPGRKEVHRSLRKDLQGILIPLSERLTPHARALHQNLATVWDGTDEVISVVEFCLTSALDELENPANSETSDRAKALIRDGLSRASSKLRKLLTSLDPSWHELVYGVYAVLGRDWQNLHQSFQSITHWNYHWLGLRYRLHRSRRIVWTVLQTIFRRMIEIADSALGWNRRRATTLIGHGQTAIGATARTDCGALYAVETLGANAIRELYAGFPLVYQKLFDLDSPSEAPFLAGRDSDLGNLNQHVKRWYQCRAGGALILPMPPGSGRSSLLRTFDSKSEGTTHSISLTSRPRNSTEFATEISSVIGIPASSIDELEARLLQSSPRICVVDNLEYCMLRASRGTQLFERVLLFFARTDTHVCWIASMNQHAWQYIQHAAPNSVNLVSTYQATSVDKLMLRRIILTRHQRSGIPLNFEKPTAISPLLSRKLNQARSTEAKQKILRNRFFDRLYLQCGSNVSLALITWLWSTKFTDGQLVVREFSPPSFDFLQSLSLIHRFALKSFLMHNTLSPQEYHQINAPTPNVASASLQTLRNFNIIIPSGISLSDLDQVPNGINNDTRYQTHPLLLYPITRLLRRKNIVH